MRFTYTTLAAAILGLASFSAHATYCAAGTLHAGQPAPYYPSRCNEPYPSGGGDTSQDQGQGQGQGQGQTANGGNGTGIATGGSGTVSGSGNSSAGLKWNGGNVTGANTLDNRNEATGGSAAVGDTTSGSASSVGDTSASSNNAVTVDAGDHSSSTTTYRDNSSFVVQPNLPGVPPAMVAGGLLSASAEPGCGPLQSKVRIPVRMLVKRKWQEVGFDEDLVPYRDANGVPQSFRMDVMPDGTKVMVGNSVTSWGTVLGNASSGGVGVAGGTGGGYGQVSVGGGNGQQQIGMRYTVRECVRSVYVPAPIVPLAVAPVARAAPPRRRAAPKRRPAQCVPQPAKVCPR